jgi:hypothetical protein
MYTRLSLNNRVKDISYALYNMIIAFLRSSHTFLLLPPYRFKEQLRISRKKIGYKFS